MAEENSTVSAKTNESLAANLVCCKSAEHYHNRLHQFANGSFATDPKQPLPAHVRHFMHACVCMSAFFQSALHAKEKLFFHMKFDKRTSFQWLQRPCA
jgi:hypothetical protein